MWKRFKQWKRLIFEMAEAEATLCLVLSQNAGRLGVPHRDILANHANALRYHSEFLRKDITKDIAKENKTWDALKDYLH